MDTKHIEKYQGLTYEAMARRVYDLATEAQLINNHELIVDGTGTGDAVIELMRKMKLNPIPIIFTSGTRPREVRGDQRSAFSLTPGARTMHMATLEEIHVPKADLVEAG
ncbi:hypothetical protein RZS08_64930, partial [Arthrospira platensis SPKY1]|nr:hypothetical protein [Arthrospira platensis SPKY1]